jgi:hypothetical protein
MLAVLLFWAYAVLVLVRFLKRRRPELAVASPIVVAYLVRVLAIAAVGATGVGSSLRGGDEIGFVSFAHAIAGSSFSSSDWLPFGHYGLYEIVFALQLRLGEFTVDTMRITDVGLATIGMTLIVVAVYDLAGPRASRLTAWLLALEPASIFFSQVLHKEPFMFLAIGLVVFGGTKIWQRLSWGGVMLMAAGGAVAVATRPYAGWFLVSAAVFVTLHAVVRNFDQRGRAIPMLLTVVAVVVVATPAVLQKTSSQSLQALQASQTANAQAAGTAGNSLALEQVNYSTRTAIITNLPPRIADLLLRPWPWQIGDSSQRFGLLGTFVAYIALWVLARYLLRWRRRRAIELAAPLLYPLLFLLIAYSLSVGNAGTGFRYRSQLVVLMIAAAVVFREQWLRSPVVAPAARVRLPRRPQFAGLAPRSASAGPLWHGKLRNSMGFEDRGA